MVNRCLEVELGDPGRKFAGPIRRTTVGRVDFLQPHHYLPPVCPRGFEQALNMIRSEGVVVIER